MPPECIFGFKGAPMKAVFACGHEEVGFFASTPRTDFCDLRWARISDLDLGAKGREGTRTAGFVSGVEE